MPSKDHGRFLLFVAQLSCMDENSVLIHYADSFLTPDYNIHKFIHIQQLFHGAKILCPVKLATFQLRKTYVYGSYVIKMISFHFDLRERHLCIRFSPQQAHLDLCA